MIERVDRTEHRKLMIQVDGEEKGGIQIPDIRDSDQSVIIVMKCGLKHTTGLHWHERKDGKSTLGQSLVTLGDKTAVYGPEDGTITIPRYTLHEFGGADNHPDGAASKDVDLRIKEWTSPPDGQKEAFFRNIVGVINDAPDGILNGIKTLLSLFVVLEEHDSYPVFTRGPAILGARAQSFIRRNTTYAIRGGISLLGKLCGFKGTYEEYTPEPLLEELRKIKKDKKSV